MYALGHAVGAIGRAIGYVTGIPSLPIALTILFMLAAAVLVTGSTAIIILGRLPIGPKAPKALLSFEEAKQQDPQVVAWAARWLSVRWQKFHFAINGTTRAGKSILLSLYLRSVISQIKKGSDKRLILFDPKNELHPDLFESVEVPVHFLMPNDWRSSRWKLAQDYTSPAAIWQFAEAVVPPVPGESSPFFSTAARRLVAGVITSLNITQPGRWDLGDVVRILDSRDYTTQVLSRTAQTRSVLDLMGEERMWAGVKATTQNMLDTLRIVAALWSRTRREFCLKDFVRSEGIVVLGRDPKFAAVLDPFNNLFFKLLFGELLAQRDSKTPRTYIVIDELSVAAGEHKPLAGFKDICERGASRGVVVAIAYHSYAAMKAIYEDSADAILGMLQNRAFLVAGDTPTAEYAAKLFGKIRQWIPMTSHTTGSNFQSSTTSSYQYHEEDVVPYEKFLKINPPSERTGLGGYRLQPGHYDSGGFFLPASWIEENRPRATGVVVKPYEGRPESHQYLEELSFADFERLRLRPSESDFAGVVPIQDTRAAVPLPLPAPAPAPTPKLEPPSPAATAPSASTSTSASKPLTEDERVAGKLRRIIQGTNRSSSSDASA